MTCGQAKPKTQHLTYLPHRFQIQKMFNYAHVLVSQFKKLKTRYTLDMDFYLPPSLEAYPGRRGYCLLLPVVASCCSCCQYCRWVLLFGCATWHSRGTIL